MAGPFEAQGASSAQDRFLRQANQSASAVSASEYMVWPRSEDDPPPQRGGRRKRHFHLPRPSGPQPIQVPSRSLDAQALADLRHQHRETQIRMSSLAITTPRSHVKISASGSPTRVSPEMPGSPEDLGKLRAHRYARAFGKSPVMGPDLSGSRKLLFPPTPTITRALGDSTVIDNSVFSQVIDAAAAHRSSNNRIDLKSTSPEPELRIAAQEQPEQASISDAPQASQPHGRYLTGSLGSSDPFGAELFQGLFDLAVGIPNYKTAPSQFPYHAYQGPGIAYDVPARAGHIRQEPSLAANGQADPNQMDIDPTLFLHNSAQAGGGSGPTTASALSSAGLEDPWAPSQVDLVTGEDLFWEYIVHFMFLAMRKAHQITPEIQMMYVSGETGEPSVETTGIIEDIVRQQVVEILRSCTEHAARRGSRSITINDLIFQIRDDAPKVSRLRTFLSWKDVRKNVKDSDDKGGEADIGAGEDPVGGGVVPGGPVDDGAKKNKKARVGLPWEPLSFFNVEVPEREDEEDEEEEEMNYITLQRLRKADERTKAMTREEYVTWSEFRQASFTYRKGKRFREWAGFGLVTDSKPSDDIVDILGFLTFEMVQTLTEEALKIKDNEDMRKDTGESAGTKKRKLAQGLFDPPSEGRTPVEPRHVQEAFRRLQQRPKKFRAMLNGTRQQQHTSLRLF